MSYEWDFNKKPNKEELLDILKLTRFTLKQVKYLLRYKVDKAKLTRYEFMCGKCGTVNRMTDKIIALLLIEEGYTHKCLCGGVTHLSRLKEDKL